MCSGIWHPDTPCHRWGVSARDRYEKDGAPVTQNCADTAGKKARQQQSAWQALAVTRPTCQAGGRGNEQPEGLTAFVRALAGVLFAAGPGAALEADFLAAASCAGHARGWNGFRGTNVGFDTDFFGHGRLRIRNWQNP